MDGRKVLEKLAKKTKTELPRGFLDEFQQDMATTAKISTEDEPQKYFTTLDLFKYRKMGLVALHLAFVFMKRI